MVDKINYLEIFVLLPSFLKILKQNGSSLFHFFRRTVSGRKTFDAFSKRKLLGFISPTLCGCDLKAVLLKIEI